MHKMLPFTFVYPIVIFSVKVRVGQVGINNSKLIINNCKQYALERNVTSRDLISLVNFQTKTC